MRCWTRLPDSSDITNSEVVQGTEEIGLREVPQQHKREDSEEHNADNNGGNNCA
jgi:hypothetical protein